MSECQHHQRKAKEESIKTDMRDVETWCRQTNLQSRNKDRDIENKYMDTRQGTGRAG